MLVRLYALTVTQEAPADQTHEPHHSCLCVSSFLTAVFLTDPCSDPHGLLPSGGSRGRLKGHMGVSALLSAVEQVPGNVFTRNGCSKRTWTLQTLSIPLPGISYAALSSRSHESEGFLEVEPTRCAGLVQAHCLFPL